MTENDSKKWPYYIQHVKSQTKIHCRTIESAYNEADKRNDFDGEIKWVMQGPHTDQKNWKFWNTKDGNVGENSD